MTVAKTFSRADWPRLLCALPAADVRQVAADLTQELSVEDLMLPQSGLGLLQLCDGALAESYYLGEIPIARAHVRLTSPDGQTGEGAAQLLDDRAGLARAIAIIDAARAARLAGWERTESLLQQGARCIAETESARRAILTATRVDFSLLGYSDEDEDDA